MDRDEFIIRVYCLVCEQYQAFHQRYCQQRTLRGGGFAPALSDEEVITIELCGEHFKCPNDQDIFDYFKAHYQCCFPALRDRPGFVRQAAALWQVKAFIQQRLVHLSGAAQDPVQAIDTMPLPNAPALLKACAKWRKKIETVGSQLSEHFALAQLRVCDLWHLQHRLIRKVLAHTVGVFLNLQLGRAPLDLDDLVTH